MYVCRPTEEGHKAAGWKTLEQNTSTTCVTTFMNNQPLFGQGRWVKLLAFWRQETPFIGPPLPFIWKNPKEQQLFFVTSSLSVCWCLPMYVGVWHTHCLPPWRCSCTPSEVVQLSPTSPHNLRQAAPLTAQVRWMTRTM